VPILYGAKLEGVLNLILRHDHQASRNEENFLQAMAGVLAVVIQRRHADEELRRAHEANKTLISSIPSLLITLDKDFKVVQFNPAAERLLGRSASDVIGRSLKDAAIKWDSELLFQRLSSFRGSLSAPEDLIFTKPDGSEGVLRVILSPIAGGGSGSDAVTLIVANDVTERRNLEAQLLQAQKLEAIGQLAAGIAHEINTPTQYIGDNLYFLQDSFKSILAYLALLPSAGEPGLAPELSEKLRAAAESSDFDFIREETPKALQQSIEGVSRIAEIVQAMKEFSHPGSKGKTLVDVNKSLSNTITVARNEWKYVSDVKTHFDPGLPSVPCVPGEINQVFLNIIVNAAHAIGETVGNSGTKGVIAVSTRLDGEMVEVRIKDSGAGIPDAIKSRIFEPFFTTKGVGKGTGQGLSIARSIIVNKHGGELFFESELGQGATFVVRLPVSEKACSAGSQDEEAQA
jgi:PAS domain S-box-containing protein